MSFNKRYVKMSTIPFLLESEERFRTYYLSDAIIFLDEESEKYFNLYHEGYTLYSLKLYYASQNNRRTVG